LFWPNWYGLGVYNGLGRETVDTGFGLYVGL
jgi:hypothetical protein